MLIQREQQSEEETTYAEEERKIVGGGVCEAGCIHPTADPVGVEHANAQPYAYARRELIEPDWTRLPGWRDVTRVEWESAQWQRANCVKNVGQLREVLGHLLPDFFYTDLERDQAERATMSLLLPPQILNTFVPDRPPDLEGMYADPVRRYMLPVFSDRDTDWPSHPYSVRDSLHEHEMWTVEGLTHRYPTKVLAEILPTCPQYCGHCTRMDIVGNSTRQVSKLKFQMKPAPRLDAMIDYLRRSPGVRDVVVSGGDVANMPWKNLEHFINRLLDVKTIRDIRLASKALMGLPQHWLQDEVRAGMERVARLAWSRGVHLAIHTHVNAPQSVTPLVAKAAKAMLETGIRDVRNQGVLLRGVNDSVQALLDLCFALLDEAGIIPYYLYMCDMIPNAEHWRVALWEAQELQQGIMGYLPGFATPRIVCDVPYVGKRWVHQAVGYDRERGISYWTKNYRTSMELDDPDALNRRYKYYDPIQTLPSASQEWWRHHAGDAVDRTVELDHAQEACKWAAPAPQVPPTEASPALTYQTFRGRCNNLASASLPGARLAGTGLIGHLTHFRGDTAEVIDLRVHQARREQCREQP